MKRRGFTLAEILITLGIVGVVAAVTIPTLSTNVNRTEIGPKLAKAVNTLENVNRTAMQQSGALVLTRAVNDANGNAVTNYIQILNEFAIGGINAARTVFVAKDGTRFSTNGAGPSAVNGCRANNKYNCSAWTVTIDINGNRDDGEYLVYVDTAGSVIPQGGTEELAYTNNNALEVADLDDCRTGDSDNNRRCIGAIADNGWRL